MSRQHDRRLKNYVTDIYEIDVSFSHISSIEEAEQLLYGQDVEQLTHMRFMVLSSVLKARSVMFSSQRGTGVNPSRNNQSSKSRSQDSTLSI